MEPEDLPWPGELEEEEEETEEEEEAKKEEEEVKSLDEDEEVKSLDEDEEVKSLDEDEVVMVEDVEDEEPRELDTDFTYESQPEESSDDYEEDDEAKAWLQAHPSGALPLPSPPKHRYSEGEWRGPEKVVPLTSHVWQQSSSQENSRTQISDSNVASSEETAQKGSGDDQRTESWHFLPQEIDSSHTSDTSQTRFNVREEETDAADFLSVEESILTQSENQVKKHNRGLFCSPLLGKASFFPLN
uniref:Uncharacterized protein n=1 Tax=Myotis myotis TaxID=51298 RepID=A0A7J7U595_MYOMY|nr:hypothetical protein mMyoMyo1_008831 [Myotis myotis]